MFSGVLRTNFIVCLQNEVRFLKWFALVWFVYFFTGALVLRFALPFLAIPAKPLSSTTLESTQISAGSVDMQMIARVYGESAMPCLFFFSGQHGGIARYESELVNSELSTLFTLIILSYPGQDGAKGRVKSFDEFANLTTQLVENSIKRLACSKIVYYGRSLGAIVAAHVASKASPTGLILESVPVSLSQTIENKLKTKWYLCPLHLLPIKRLIPQDFAVEDLLKTASVENIVIYQGKIDSITPLPDLKPIASRNNIDFVEVEQGTHYSTFALVKPHVAELTAHWLYMEE